MNEHVTNIFGKLKKVRSIRQPPPPSLLYPPTSFSYSFLLHSLVSLPPPTNLPLNSLFPPSIHFFSPFHLSLIIPLQPPSHFSQFPISLILPLSPFSFDLFPYFQFSLFSPSFSLSSLFLPLPSPTQSPRFPPSLSLH